MDKQEYFLKKHGIVLDKSRSPEEQNQQMKIGFGVKDIETGDKPYIFISYSHKDSAVVFPAIKALQEKGYPVWYDDSIRTGVAWRTHIAERVRDSALVIAFMSENSVASKNCIAEVDHAIDLNLPILTVRLDRSPIPPGLGMYLNREQMFQAYLYDGDAYITRLAADPTVAETAGEALDAYNAEKRRVAEEAERKRKEVEAAERRRKEAEELERKRKEAEEADRRRKEAEIAEQMQRKRQSLKRKREEKEAELEQLRKEEAELGSLNEIEARYYEALQAAEKNCKDAVEALNKEQRLRAEAERKNRNLEARLRSMEQSQNLKQIPEDAEGIFAIIKEKKLLGEVLALQLRDYWNSFTRWWNINDIILWGKVWILLMAVVFMVVHILLLRTVYTDEMSFWLKLLTYAAPMLVIVNVGSLFASRIICPMIISVLCDEFAWGTFIACLVICFLIDMFLYPGAVTWKCLLSSLGFNVSSAIASLLIFYLLDEVAMI